MHFNITLQYVFGFEGCYILVYNSLSGLAGFGPVVINFNNILQSMPAQCLACPDPMYKTYCSHWEVAGRKGNHFHIFPSLYI
jgi:hypothetical protein